MEVHEMLDAARGPRPEHGGSSWTAMIVFISIALYNVLELNFLIANTFKKYQGLYFWSLLIATWGVALNAIGYLLRILRVDQSGYVHSTLILIGWCAMVTGQSLVLYSRLHLVLHNPTILRCVLVMIIVDAVWLGIPVIILVYGSNSDMPMRFIRPYAIFERLQLSVFTVQELIISGLYIVETAKILKLQGSAGFAPSSARHFMAHLILANVFIVLLDVSVLVLEFTNHYVIQTAWKPLVYSVKLKVEFSVLNRLVEFSQHMKTGSLRKMSSSNEKGYSPDQLMSTAPGTPTDTRYSVHVGASRSPELNGDELSELGVVKTTDVYIEHSGRESDIGDCSLSGHSPRSSSMHHDADDVQGRWLSPQSESIRATLSHALSDDRNLPHG